MEGKYNIYHNKYQNLKIVLRHPTKVSCFSPSACISHSLCSLLSARASFVAPEKRLCLGVTKPSHSSW